MHRVNQTHSTDALFCTVVVGNPVVVVGTVVSLVVVGIFVVVTAGEGGADSKVVGGVCAELATVVVEEVSMVAVGDSVLVATVAGTVVSMVAVGDTVVDAIVLVIKDKNLKVPVVDATVVVDPTVVVGVQEDAKLYCSYLRCGDLRSPGATERRNGSLGLYATTITMLMMMKDDLCQKWRVKLFFSRHLQTVRNRDC